MAQVVVAGLTKRFRPHGHPAVEALSLTLEPGEFLSLLGPSGCGKTTTLRLIAGFERADAGRVTIDGRLVVAAGDGSAVWIPPEQRRVGMVFQDYALFPHLAVEDNVAFGLRALPGPERAERVRQVLDLVGLVELRRRYPHELSGGEQQRVALARALAPAPAVMLLDEPFSGLDADLRAQMREDVETVLRATRTSTIFVTHDQEEAFTLADRVGVLNRGRLEQIGRPEEIYHRPATRFVAEFVGAANFLPGVVRPGGILTEIGTVPNPDGHPPGRKVSVMLRPDDVTFVPRPDGEAVILHRSFRGSETVYRLGLPSGRELHASRASSAPFTAGMRVQPEMHPLHVVVFVDE